MDPLTIQLLTKLVVKPFNVLPTLASLAALVAMDRALAMVTQQMTMKIKMVPEEEAAQAAVHAVDQVVAAVTEEATAVLAVADSTEVVAVEAVEAVEAVSTSTRMSTVSETNKGPDCDTLLPLA